MDSPWFFFFRCSRHLFQPAFILFSFKTQSYRFSLSIQEFFSEIFYKNISLSRIPTNFLSTAM